jgi:hypothetical protein
MAVTIELRKDGWWCVSSLCVTKAEAFAKAARIEEVRAEAFQPEPPPRTHHAVEAPMPPHVAEIIARHEDDDTPEAGLNFDKPRTPVSQKDEE